MPEAFVFTEKVGLAIFAALVKHLLVTIKLRIGVKRINANLHRIQLNLIASRIACVSFQKNFIPGVRIAVHHSSCRLDHLVHYLVVGHHAGDYWRAHVVAASLGGVADQSIYGHR